MAKHFAGAQIRTVRTSRGLTQVEMARKLDISTSYLNQLENDQRPLTVTVLLQLSRVFGLDASVFSPDAQRRTVSELAELLPDVDGSELHDFAARYPTVAQAVLGIPSLVDAAADNPHLIIRDFFQDHENYFHDLDVAAERFAAQAPSRQLRLTRLAAAFDRDYGYTVRFNQYPSGARSIVDEDERVVRLRTGLTEAQQCFELSYTRRPVTKHARPATRPPRTWTIFRCRGDHALRGNPCLGGSNAIRHRHDRRPVWHRF